MIRGLTAPSRPHRVFYLSFIVFFLSISVWSLATPLMSAPDEPVHVAKAAAVVRGQLTGKLLGGSMGVDGIVKIPSAYANLGNLVYCYQYKASVPASCAPKYQPTKAIVSDTIYNARYQPLYYAIVGLPTLFTQSSLGIYLMRIVSALLSATFLALSIMAVVRWSSSRIMLMGIIVACTPSVIFFDGVVNPTGLEISAAICLWTALLILFRERLKNPPPGLIALVAVAASVESLVRSLSPLWVLLALVTALAVADKRHLKQFVHKKSVWIAAGFSAACAIVASIWILAFHSLNVESGGEMIAKNIGNLHLLFLSLTRTKLYYSETISRFGWLDVHSPIFVYVVWTVLLLVLYLLAIYTATRRLRVVLIALLLAVIIIPVLISADKARRLGVVWQGKDGLPFFVGIPIFASTVLAKSSIASKETIRRFFIPLIAVVAGIATVVAFYGNLRRNSVGDSGSLFSIFHSTWQPPLTTTGVLIFEILATVLLIAMYVLFSRIPPTNHSGQLPKVKV